MKSSIRNIFRSLLYWDFSLLAMVIFLIFIIPLLPGDLHSMLYDIFFTLIYIFAALAVGIKSKSIIWFALGVIILRWLSTILNMQILNAVSRSFSILFFIAIVIIFIVGIARAKKVGMNIILDAINGYLLLSIVFGILVALIMKFNPEAFNFPELEPSVVNSSRDFSEYMYYSLVSITTLGYGDIVPKIPVARSLATFISICGQLYIAILLALLVGKFAASQNK
jgi:hypothetical protein